MTYFTTTTSLQNYEKDILTRLQQKYENDIDTLQIEQNKLYSQLDACYRDRLRHDVQLSNDDTVKEFFQIIEDNYNNLENPYETIAFLNDNLIFSLKVSDREYLDTEKNWKPTLDNSKYYIHTPYRDVYTVYFKNSTLFLNVSYKDFSNTERQIQKISIIHLLRQPSFESPQCVNE